MATKKFNIGGTLRPLDSIFGDEAAVPANAGIVQIPLEKLRGFDAHPFKVRDDADMAELAESIVAEGVMVPILVRPYGGEGEYQIIAGHRRKRACELAGLAEIPAIVRELDDDGAVAYMVDSNLQRSKVLPSEKAWAYKMKLDAMKRQAGRPKENVSPVGTHFRSDEMLAQQSGESQDQIRRYIRLTELVPELLDRADAETISVRAGVELSYIPADGQRIIESNIAEFEQSGSKRFTVSMKQAEALRAFSEDLDEERVCEILFGKPKEPKFKLTLNTEQIRGFFPPDTDADEIEETIIRLLERWRKRDGRLENQ